MIESLRYPRLLETVTEPTSVLCEESQAHRELPVNFNERDVGLFGHELSAPIPATRLFELSDAKISTDNIVFKGDRILRESFNYPSEFVRWASTNNVLKFYLRNYLRKRRSRLNERAVWVIDNWGAAYFHWFADALTRLYTLRERLADCVLLLPESFSTAAYVAPSLVPLGVGQIRFIKADELVDCRQLLVPSHTAPSGHHNVALVCGLRQLYTSYYHRAEGAPVGERIYISRAKAKRRKIINEGEVAAALAQAGFKTVCLEDYKFEEQVGLMLNARHVVSNHGAGLTNMLFLRSGSSVLEIRKRGDSHNNSYFFLASALKLKYYYQLGQPEDPSEDAYSANVFVDVDKLRRNLELMLKHERTASTRMVSC
jgi:glycosyl transferase family 61